MKKTLSLSLLLLAFGFIVKAQNLQAVTDIGNTTNNALFINGSGKYNTIGNYNGLMLYFYNGAGYVDVMNPSTSVFSPLWLRGSTIQTNNRLLINNATDDGNTALLVNGNIKTNGYNYRAFTADLVSGYTTIDISENNNRRAFMGYSTGSNIVTFGAVDDNGTERGLYLHRLSGNVGIGAYNPQSKLAVAGTITAHRVRVTTNPADWPDYVFHENYSLPSLQAVKQYVNTHKHLPDIPSAGEVEKNGQDLGEMNKQLLKKVEELTLYIIQQQEQITALNERLKKVEKQ
ncbi:hypothetical protein [Chitinophaga sp. HK235]|uniref:hypothetical protein n=1 Tax=Chitinophaga sp. HK235 TaxID=2952571 RepID=UPI001BA7C48C|nr:hypothetical protein [Chitinophaga sp. HK235]